MPQPSPTIPPLDADLSGRQLGDYRVLRRLGKGGMAEVYLAEQQSLKRQVALKVLKRELASDQKYVKRFQMEAQAAASLVHANIVQIHEVGCIDGIQYIAQEYVQGQNLREKLAHDGSLDLRVSLKIMRQVAAALHLAGQRGIVHRDVKPENIMLSRSGEVKVADFGLARVTRENDLNLTQDGQTMGTPLYMSPEQVEGRPLDPRSDIYSLGVTCYHMLAGKPPFDGDTALSVAMQHLRTQPLRLENLRPDLPSSVARIVHKMLAKEPEQRFASARDLIRDLRNLRIEGLGDDWDEWFEEADTSLLHDSPDDRTAAMLQLNQLMRAAAAVRRKRQLLWLKWLGAMAAALLLGVSVAWATRPEYLLKGSLQPIPKIAKKDSPSAQYFYALQAKTEEAWQAVVDYFPEPKHEYFRQLAEKELALIYVTQPHAEDQALVLFDRLAGLSESDLELRAFGIAGQAVVYTLQQNYKTSRQKLADLLPLLRDRAPGQHGAQLDPRMERLVRDAARLNDKVLNQKTEDQLQELFNTRASETD